MSVNNLFDTNFRKVLVHGWGVGEVVLVKLV